MQYHKKSYYLLNHFSFFSYSLVHSLLNCLYSNSEGFAFFNSIFPYRQKSDNVKGKNDVIFEIFSMLYTMVIKNTNHITLCEIIHDVCQSKKLKQTLNRMGLPMSYNKLERINIELAKQGEAAQSHHIPVPPIIQSYDSRCHG